MNKNDDDVQLKIIKSVLKRQKDIQCNSLKDRNKRIEVLSQREEIFLVKDFTFGP